MARRWLLGILTGVGFTLASATGAAALELPAEPVAVETEVLDVEVEADTEEPSLTVSVTGDAVVDEAETTLAPEATVELGPAGPSVSTGGDAEVAGEALPIPQVEVPEDEAPAASGPTGSTKAAGSDVAPAPRPAGTTTEDRRSSAAPMSADRAAARAGITATTGSVFAEEPAPLVAPAEETLPLVAAAAPVAPVTELALPVIDTTPTVPGLLRLLAGLLVVGAAATWRTVQQELA